MTEVRGGRRPATPGEAHALAHPVRIRIIRELFDETLTNSQLAERLSRDKATVLHHVRVLIDAGFLAALPVRPGPRGSRERPYRSTGKSWNLSLEDSDQAPVVDDAMFAAFAQEIALPHETVALSRLVLRLGEAERAELSTRLQAVLDTYVDHPTDPSGRKVAVYLHVYLPELA